MKKPKCHYCGTEMVKDGLSGKYRCPNAPHPECPKCGRCMIVPFVGNGLVRDYSKLHCNNCHKTYNVDEFEEVI